MRAHRKAESAFFYVDCDTVSVLYLGVAERLNLPVYVIDLPGHMFVRWKSESLTLNWDPNEGRVIEDGEYFRRWSVTPDMQRLFGYGECRSSSYLHSYWQWLVGLVHCRRGDYTAGERSFRAAVQIDPDNLVARNELAWVLATCPDVSLRNDVQAVKSGEELVARARRVKWLDTLAAAYAESGDCERARTTIAAARAVLDSDPSAVAANELVGDLTRIEQAYAAGLTYVQAVRAGTIRGLIAAAALNDVTVSP